MSSEIFCNFLLPRDVFLLSPYSPSYFPRLGCLCPSVLSCLPERSEERFVIFSSSRSCTFPGSPIAYPTIPFARTAQLRKLSREWHSTVQHISATAEARNCPFQSTSQVNYYVILCQILFLYMKSHMGWSHGNPRSRNPPYAREPGITESAVCGRNWD
jgi:hypothetical protein